MEIRIARELTAERAEELLKEHGQLRVALADFARAWNPASTTRSLYGPLVIDYVLYPDGGVTATVAA